MVASHLSRGIIVWLPVHFWSRSLSRRNRISRRTTETLLYSSRSYAGNNAHSSIRSNTAKHPYTLKWEPVDNAVYWFELRLAQNKGLELWLTINDAIILCDSMLADCLVKAVKRKLHDTEAEILFERRELEQRQVLRVYWKTIPLPKPGEILYASKESHWGWKELLINDGLMEFPMKPSNKLQALCYYFGESSYEVIKKERADGQICPDDVKTFTRCQWSFQADHKGTRQHWRVRDTWTLSNKVQCEHCHKHMSSGHVCCHCGSSVVYHLSKARHFEADAA